MLTISALSRLFTVSAQVQGSGKSCLPSILYPGYTQSVHRSEVLVNHACHLYYIQPTHSQCTGPGLWWTMLAISTLSRLLIVSAQIQGCSEPCLPSLLYPGYSQSVHRSRVVVNHAYHLCFIQATQSQYTVLGPPLAMFVLSFYRISPSYKPITC